MSSYICICYAVTEEQIREAIRLTKAKTIQEVTNICYAGGDCGSCHDQIENLIEEYWENNHED
jgi:NifU-like protein